MHFYCRYMAICHPFLVQRSRPTCKSTYHAVLIKGGTVEANMRRKQLDHHNSSPEVAKFSQKDGGFNHTTPNGSSSGVKNWFTKIKTGELRWNASSRNVGGTNHTFAPSGSMMLKKRTCHYLFPALIFSILVNIPKFFEFVTFDMP